MSQWLDPVAFREGVYGQIYDAAYAVARNQSPDVAAHAEDIAMNIVLKFTKRQMTNKVENPAAWGAKHARYACTNYANRQVKRRRNEDVNDEAFWEERIDINPEIYPYKSVAGADAIAFALACLNDREREMVHLVEAGYSHAEVAEMMGYAGARSVTTTMNRIRVKITEHVGSREEVEELLRTSSYALVARPAVSPLEPDRTDARNQEFDESPTDQDD
jgi:RNA polymerase sigma factor (sigma-70 family)